MERERWATTRERAPRALRALAPLLLAGTVALAGCGRFEIGIERPGALATPTVTPPPATATVPAPAPTATATTAAGIAPPTTIAATVPSGSPPPGAATPTPRPRSAGPSVPDPGAAAIGERREQAGIALTINGASGATNINNVYRPDAGKFYLILDLTVENIGRDKFTLNTFEAHLYDAQGNNYPPQTALLPPPGLVVQQVARGATVRGNLAYEVSPSADGLFWAFEPYQGVGGEKVKLQVAIGSGGSYAPTPGASARPAATPTAAPPGATAPASAPPVVRPTGTPAALVPAPTPTAGARPTGTAGGTGAPNGWGPSLTPLAGGQVYSDPRGRFSFRVPTDWIKTPVSGGEIAFADPTSGAIMGVVLENLSGAPGTTIESYHEAAERQLRQQFADYTPISTERITIAGRQGYKRVSRVSAQGTTIQLVSIYFLDGATAHILSFGCDPDDYAAQAPTFDGIAGSYQVGAGASRGPRAAGASGAGGGAILAVARRAAR